MLCAAIYSRRDNGPSVHAAAMARGLQRHGIRTTYYTSIPKEKFDFLVPWGWRNGQRCKEYGHTVLLMERGYIDDRFKWTSLGWEGLNGKAVWHETPAENRFEKLFPELMKPWRRRDGYALVLGQVNGDAAVQHIDIDSWCSRTVRELLKLGHDVRYRPHPVSVQRNHRLPAVTCPILSGTLEEALAGAGFAVTFNSNSGVDAVMEGIPTIAMDPGSMAWPVTSHGLEDELVTPDRSAWCNDLAWRQWSIDEIQSGYAWEFVGQAFG